MLQRPSGGWEQMGADVRRLSTKRYPRRILTTYSPPAPRSSRPDGDGRALRSQMLGLPNGAPDVRVRAHEP